MKAYVCSIGELTTDICVEQLEKYGFDVTVIGGVEAWYDKYKKFIFMAEDTCIRIDADVIVNENIRDFELAGFGMVQAHTYDMYKNKAGITSPVYYSPSVLRLIRENWEKVGTGRPEADASRIPEVNVMLDTMDTIVGIHGVYQRDEDIERHYKHKVERKQIGGYDFELINKLQALWRKD